mgnify:CR=1 FL=1
MQFRKDINGLRAIAVIAVVLFHFNPSWLSGGFAGVDVFFVISGFLMTGIIFRGIEQKNFSILKFYVDRSNRIIPALAVLCLVLLFFGWFFLTPLDYRTLGKHTVSSVGFFSNFIYWSESGYFNSASHGKWLLHTWSLSVEWQFYIIYPIVLVVMRNIMSLKAMKTTVLLGSLLVFIFCIIASYQWPNPSYYLLPTRAWEMMLGGVAYIYPLTLLEKNKKFLEWLGLLLIAGSYFFISKDNPWPGYLAIFPVLGSFLIIQAQRNDSLVTSNIVFQKIGVWSYSIYLWHWPIVVGIYYFSLKGIFVYLGILLSILLGFLSNKYVEKIKIKNNFDLALSYLKCKPVWVAIFVIALGGFVYQKNYFIYGIPKKIYDGMIIDKNTDGYGKFTWRKHHELDKKVSFADKKYKILIIGDSQAGDFINALYTVGVNNEVDIVSRVIERKCGAFYIESKSLINLFDNNIKKINNFDTNKCHNSIAKLRGDRVVDDADVIIISMSWGDTHFPFILESISNIRSKNMKAGIYLVGNKGFSEQVPEMMYKAYLKKVELNNYAFDEIRADVSYQNKIFEESQLEFDYKYINMTDILCYDSKCSVFDKNKGLFYYDSQHLTKAGAKYIGEQIKNKGKLPSFLYAHYIVK